MSTGAFTMVGNPGESAKTVQETIDFLRTLPMTDLPSTSILYVLPGTLLYETLCKEGHIHDDDWVKYDTVPSYTMQNSFLTLLRWARKIDQSADRIPFDREKHFFYRTIETSDLEKNSKAISLLRRLWKIALKPQLFAQNAKRFLPAGKVRF